MKEDCASDGEDDVSTDALVEEILQQADTAVIYPEAPDDELQRQGTPDTSIHDENGTGYHTTDCVHKSLFPLRGSQSLSPHMTTASTQ